MKWGQDPLLYPWIIDVADNYIKEVNILPAKKRTEQSEKVCVKKDFFGW